MAQRVNLSAAEPLRPVSLAEQAYTAVRDRIVTLQLPPGAPINEEALSRELGVGRTPLREAVKRLEAESLVAIYPRRGTFVTEVNLTDHGLIADVRRQLEGHAAQRAAERATPADRAQLSSYAGRIRRGRLAPAALMTLDTDVHRALYRATRNRYLEATLSQYYNLSLRIWYLFLDRLPGMAEHIGEHVPLLDAVVGGDADLARALAVAHVDHFERAVREAL